MDDEDTSKTSSPGPTSTGDARSNRAAKRRGQQEIDGNPAQSPAVPTTKSPAKQNKSTTAMKKSKKKKTKVKKLRSGRDNKGFALSLAIRDVMIKHGVHPSFYGSLLEDER